jgi:ribosomal protein S18 acetylase RimI-like enzyme
MNNIRPMRSRDVKDIVEIHLKSFPGFFLTFLGPRFLHEFYTGVLNDPAGFAFVYTDNGRVIGFVAGASAPSNFYSRLLQQRWWRFAFTSFMPALRNPLIIPRLFRAFRKPQDVSKRADTGTLMSVAVAPDAQGHGVGRTLVDAFLKEAIHRKLKYVDLTTDRDNNNSVNQFYVSRGFRCSRVFVTSEGRVMNEYIIDL